MIIFYNEEGSIVGYVDGSNDDSNIGMNVAGIPMKKKVIEDKDILKRLDEGKDELQFYRIVNDKFEKKTDKEIEDFKKAREAKNKEFQELRDREYSNKLKLKNELKDLATDKEKIDRLIDLL